MGVFTIFCACCGAPAMDLQWWINERPELNYEQRSTRWLNECTVITPVGIMSNGCCDDYGRVECRDAQAIVCKGNWPEINFNLKPWELDGDEEVAGVLVHDVCYRVFLKACFDKVSSRVLFETLANCMDDWGSGVVDCGDICENWGQDYQLNEGQQWLITNPAPDFQFGGLHSEPAQAPGSFAQLPSPVVFFILHYLSPQDLLLNFGSCSHSARTLSKHRSLWSLRGGLMSPDNSEYMQFSHADAQRNYARVLPIAQSIRELFEDDDGWRSMNVSQLKSELRARKLKVGGRKVDLIERLQQHKRAKKE